MTQGTKSGVNLKGLPIEALEEIAISRGHSAFRGRQLFLWINQKKISDFDQMSDLSKAFREDLKKEFVIPSIQAEAGEPSADGTIKYLIKLNDGQTVEAVYIPAENRRTLCVSTQVGCKMACSFCATGYMGFIRNLEAWEIVDQLLSTPTPLPVTNIVMMGMGEPFDNYEAITNAIKIFRHSSGFQIGKKRITVSTVGLTDQIKQFVKDDLGLLAISLHGTTDEQRSKIMPINKRIPLAELLQTCKELPLRKGQRITFEYLLIKDHNDSDEDARRLVKLLSNIPTKINLLNYNENPFVDFKRTPEERVLRFQKILMERDFTVTYRRSRGRDVNAACGQLRTSLRSDRIQERESRVCG